MTAHYHSSKGPKLIEAMPYPYLQNAHDKLVREEPHRTDEIEAMAKRLAEIDEEINAL